MLTPPEDHLLFLAERWLKLLSDLGRAQATLSAYRSALSHYFAFCSQNSIEPENARFEDLAAYISPQLPGMPFPAASATLQLRLCAIRLWYDFLVYQDICSLNPLPRAGLPGAIYTGRGLVPRITRLPVIPDDEQWLRFLKHVSAASLRDRLMLALAYFGALRRAEVTALALEDIDPAHRLIRIRPTQLAASFLKADRVAHMISVLIDHDPEAASLTGPATYYDLGDSYCTNPFWSSCQQRMACIGCDFNLLKESSRGLVLESKASVRRYLEEAPLTPDERAIVEQDAEKIEQALKRLSLKPEV